MGKGESLDLGTGHCFSFGKEQEVAYIIQGKTQRPRPEDKSQTLEVVARIDAMAALSPAWLGKHSDLFVITDGLNVATRFPGKNPDRRGCFHQQAIQKNIKKTLASVVTTGSILILEQDGRKVKFTSRPMSKTSIVFLLARRAVKMSGHKSESNFLVAGGLAAVLASACCLGPLVLVSIGVGGAWVANLHALEPYRPGFLTVVLASLFFAWRRIFRSQAECKPGAICALPPRRIYKIFFWVVAALALAALVFPWLAPFFY